MGRLTREAGIWSCDLRANERPRKKLHKKGTDTYIHKLTSRLYERIGQGPILWKNCMYKKEPLFTTFSSTSYFPESTHVYYKVSLRTVKCFFNFYPVFLSYSSAVPLSPSPPVFLSPYQIYPFITVPFTKPPLFQESRLTGDGSPILVDLVERKVPLERIMGAANSFHWFHPWL